MKNKLQIGIMGSCSDLIYSKKAEKAAEELGFWIAKSGAILIFGAEKDIYSLSQAACKGAKKAGGLTVGITYGKGMNTVEGADVIIPSGLDRGGGREFVLALSCNSIITISGGSGTLNEIAVAYQANIPIIALKGFGGWSDCLSDTYLDSRQRRKIIGVEKPKNAVDIALSEARKMLESQFKCRIKSNK